MIIPSKLRRQFSTHILRPVTGLTKYLFELFAFIIPLLLPGYNNAVLAQGCSDAGFCTIGNLHQSTESATKKYNQKISLFLPLGVGDEKVFVFAPGIQYDNQLNDRWAIQGKLTGNYASGSLGNTAGAGDVFLSGVYQFKPSSGWSSSLLLGTKLPLHSGNLKNGNGALPMQYQRSLGTLDIITGLSTGNEHLQLAAGWQQPLSGSNNNQFIPGDVPNTTAKNYPPSRNFIRKGDVLLRGAYTLKPLTAVSLTAGLLGIYHLGKDSYEDVNNKRLAIDGSNGLTLNVTFAASWRVTGKTTIGLSAGSPLVAREVRPDGLTRKFVVAPEISWNF